MNELLKNPLFWQLIGAALTFLAIITAIIIYLLQRHKKMISYEILSHNSLLNFHDEEEGKFQLLYEGTPVKNVQIIVLKIINSGNVPITKNDFEQKLCISFGNNSTILSVEIIDQRPENLDPYIEIYNEKIILDSLLLNRNDSITIKATINDPIGQMKNFKEDIKVDARILGVEIIKRI